MSMIVEGFGFLATVCIGLILGILGGGGSILAIPILVYLFHKDPVIASAYSLFIVGITSLVGAIPKWHEDLVNLKTGLTFGIPSILSIFSTRKWIIPAIPEEVLTLDSFIITKRILILGVFSLLMITASTVMIKGRNLQSDDDKMHVGLVIIEGILIGFLTGFVGAGGGFLIIPALVFFTGLPFKTAVGTSLFIIAINSLSGFAGDVLNYTIEWKFIITLSSLAVIGILIGNQLSRTINSKILRKAFGWFILIMGTWILWKEI